MKKQMNPRTITIAVAGLTLFVVLIGYMALVRPQKAKAAKLAKEIVAVQAQVSANRVATSSVAHPTAVRVRAEDLFRVSKAIPDRTDMAGILLQLSELASDTGLTVESVTPGGLSAQTGYQRLPVGITVQGNYYELSDFLFRVRNLVTVRHGTLSATGRLLTVQSIDLQPPSQGAFPLVGASLQIDSFVFGTAVAPPTAPTTLTPVTTPDATTPPASPPGGTTPAAGAAN
jgi:Tfp pilus assembly protein PilO